MQQMLKDTLDKLSRKSKHSLERATNQNVKLAVTGFQGAGKSVFIASLIHQLLHVNRYNNLPFFKLAEEDRLIAAQLEVVPDLTIPEFPYQASVNALMEGDWPESTRSVSALRLSLRYKTENSLISKIVEKPTITIDVYDYPGEWLVDLIMLNQSYEEWSEYVGKLTKNEELYESSADWKSCFVELNDSSIDIDEWIKRTAEQYRGYLKDKAAQGAICMPGRFVLPGELEGAPVLDFFPIPEGALEQSKVDTETIKERLKEKYDFYLKQVITPFFENYFSQFDRQIILVDCLSLLNKSKQRAQEIESALSHLLKAFHYGHSNWIKRLFKPQIDKLIFAATKSDQVPSNQQYRLQSFLQSLVYASESKVRFEGVESHLLTLSSIRAAEAVVAEINGENVHCVKGTLKENNEEVIVYPGEVPESIDSLFSREHEPYELPAYSPNVLNTSAHSELPHIRMGKVLELVLGDKLL
ncbi:YcjX family protein [Pleionea sp. CnH1-48]|uniref:YcjX family protein n=1 Tax=Pleionea sp. CnH1-48 TaxID=2954494 RepID=UPI00209722CA|nr:YcjX family protein [Pleionea sp. CnH1-48]MCO7225436.1 YcjX family protein [Pleionea sp. CnH1-48]